MEITSTEFTEWIQYMNMEPPSDQKRAYEAAQICLCIVKAMGGDKKSTIDDFLLKYNTSTSKTNLPSATELKTKLWAWLGIEKRKRGK